MRRPWLAAPLLALFLAPLALVAGVVGDARAQAPPAPGSPPRVHVRGASRIDARPSRSRSGDSGLFITGSLVDDAAHPVPSARIALAVSLKTDPTRDLPLSVASPSVCNEAVGPKVPVLERRDRLTLETDSAGHFCVRLSLPVDRYVAHLGFDAEGNIDAAHLDLPIDLALQPVDLAFDPQPRTLSLDLAAPQESLDAVATVEEDRATSPAVDVALTLTNETGTILATGLTNAQGRLKLTPARASLGPPGKGELRVAFAGNAEMAPSTHVAEIERRTHVDLTVPDAKDGRLAPGAPEDGVTMVVVASPRSGAGAAPPGGSVEAWVGDTSVGAAPIEAGKAHLVVTFAAQGVNDTAIHLRYVPETPWFEAGNETIVTLPLKEPSLLRRAPLVLAGLAVVVWLALGRSSRVRAPKEKAAKKRGAPAAAGGGEARVELVRAGPGARGWTGHVADAHDGYAIGAARVQIHRAGFENVLTLASVETHDDGSFALPAVATQDGDRLVVESRFHSPLEQPVPPSGELMIALVLRKRALLDRLVSWARRRGKPFDSGPEPTPGHVRRAAGAEFAVAKWADAVERAAYGGVDVDERAEAEVERLAPLARPVSVSLEEPVAEAPPAGFDMTVKDDGPPDGGDRAGPGDGGRRR